MRFTEYRYPNEQFILCVTVLALGAVALFAAGTTLCLAPFLFGGMVVLAFLLNRTHHQELMQRAVEVNPHTTPVLAGLAADCLRGLRPGNVLIYLTHQRQLNAYTFGVGDPKVVVLYSALLEVMDEDELRFVLGHELGHVALNHAWLNTLLGGMAGIPVSFGGAVILTLAFRWWNRACENSADRAGLLACGKPEKAVTALVKLAYGAAGSPAELKRALTLIDREDDSPLNVLAEILSTHPMMIRRIEQLRRYAATPQYRRLQQLVERNQAHS